MAALKKSPRITKPTAKAAWWVHLPHLEFLLVQQHVVSLQVHVLLPLVAQLPLCRGEQTLDPLEVLLQLPGLLRLLAQDQVLRLGEKKAGQAGSITLKVRRVRMEVRPVC